MKLNFKNVFNTIKESYGWNLDFQSAKDLIKYYYDKDQKEVSEEEFSKWEVMYLGMDLYEDIRFGEWHEFGWEPDDSLTFTEYDLILLTPTMALVHFDTKNKNRMIKSRGYNPEEIEKVNIYNMNDLYDLGIDNVEPEHTALELLLLENPEVEI